MPSKMIATVCSFAFVLLTTTRVLHADLIFSGGDLGTVVGGDFNPNRFLASVLLPPSPSAIPVSGVNVSIGLILAGTGGSLAGEDVGTLELLRNFPELEVLVEFFTDPRASNLEFGCDEELCREVFPGAPNLVPTIEWSDRTVDQIEFIPTTEPSGILIITTLTLLIGALRFGRPRSTSSSSRSCR